MKEDILEQLVEDWLVSQPGWFVKHNVKFRPSREEADHDKNKDSVRSDVDIIAISGTAKGISRVKVVTCKSWQSGFNVNKWKADLEQEAAYNEPSLEFQKKESWKSFRELVSIKWLKAFVAKVEEETGQREFEYCIAVTMIRGSEEDIRAFEQSEIILNRFKKANAKVKLRIVPVSQLVAELLERLSNQKTKAPESTEIGRLLQVLKAAGIDFN